MAENVRGLEALKAALARYRKSMMTDVASAVEEELEAIKAESMAHTPVQYGTLKAEHRVVIHHDGKKITGRIEVGGAAEPYAMAVHEHLSEHSPPSWKAAEATGDGVHFTSGGPKFLENAARAALPGFADRVMARVAARRG